MHLIVISGGKFEQEKEQLEMGGFCTSAAPPSGKEPPAAPPAPR